jgi:hypothetical protein
MNEGSLRDGRRERRGGAAMGSSMEQMVFKE